MTFGRYGVELGLITLTYFGLIVLAALAAGLGLATLAARRRGWEAGDLLDAAAWALIGAVVLGRIFYIWSPPPSVAAFYDRHWYLTHVLDFQAGPLAVWSGGLGRAGLLIGALAGGAFGLRRSEHTLAEWADLLTPAVLLVLTLLPLANLVNGQLYGPPTALPWGLPLGRRVPPFDDLSAYPPGTRFHPTPAYAALWALLSLAVVAIAGRRWRVIRETGDRALLAACVYLPGLFLLDALRFDVARGLAGLSGLQAVAVVAGTAAMWGLVRRYQGHDPTAAGANTE